MATAQNTSTAPPTGRPASDAATQLDTAEEAATTSLYRAAIGAVRTDYYLSRFVRFEETGRVGLSWNWTASLCTLNWMAFRQLWGPALAYVGAINALALAIFGIGRLVFQFSETTETMLLAVFAVLAFAIPGLIGNAVLHADCRKKMARALSTTTTLPEACAILSRQASTRMRLIWLALINGLLIGTVTAGYLFFPDLASLPARPPAETVQAQPTVPAVTPTVAVSTPVAATATVSTPESATTTVVATPEPLPTSTVTTAVAAASPPPVATKAVAKAAKPAATAKAHATSLKKEHAAVVKPNAPAAEGTSGVYYINVGLFANQDNARMAHTKLLDAGLSSVSTEFNTSKGRRTRVRVGPFSSKDDADSTATKIRALNLEAQVFQK